VSVPAQPSETKPIMDKTRSQIKTIPPYFKKVYFRRIFFRCAEAQLLADAVSGVDFLN
jgi:hypothetical protein